MHWSGRAAVSSGIDELYRRYFPLIREKCGRTLDDPEDARDVSQETFIRLWRAGLANDAPENVIGWIYRTSTRLAIDRIRRRRLMKSVDIDPDLPGHEAPTDGILQARYELAQLIQRSPRVELEVVLLHRVDGLTQPEVAAVVGISERTVRRCLASFDARAREWRGVPS